MNKYLIKSLFQLAIDSLEFIQSLFSDFIDIFNHLSLLIDLLAKNQDVMKKSGEIPLPPDEPSLLVEEHLDILRLIFHPVSKQTVREKS